tara:strand:+ start:8747 stop:10117 length:1371 start_codon:yes stop_codon:yes gene_type:complete
MKKKILLMSDDLRMHSGVATVSREIVMGTLHHYDWVQLGGAIDHPEANKIADLSDSAMDELGLKEKPYIKIYPISGYGNPDLVRELIEIEKPDAILHYTDPRFWIWLYQMEHEIRISIPIFYYNIWDDLPDPKWNENFYRSCDLLMAISKQTYGINRRMLPDYKDWQVTYVPHGINSNHFFKVNKNNSEFRDFQSKFSFDRYDFKVLYLNRNIRRKQPGDVILAYKHFVEKLPEDEQKKCLMVWHTSPIDDNGTDLRAACAAMIPEHNYVFTYDINNGPFSLKDMNYIYNSVDVYINLASNEGFGLGSCEALSVGVPIVVNVTGGLQDQCGFTKEDGSYLTPEDYVELGTNHDKKITNHGEWVKPVWPSNISLQGSPPTPYIFDDRCSWDEAGEALLEWYNAGHEERVRCGNLGYEFVKNEKIGMDSKEMSRRFISSMDMAMKKFVPRKKYILEKI